MENISQKKEDLFDRFEDFLQENGIKPIPEDDFSEKKEAVLKRILEEEKVPRMIMGLLGIISIISLLAFFVAAIIGAIAGVGFIFISLIDSEKVVWYADNLSLPILITIVCSLVINKLSENVYSELGRRVTTEGWGENLAERVLPSNIPPGYKDIIRKINEFDSGMGNYISTYLGQIPGREEQYLLADVNKRDRENEAYPPVFPSFEVRRYYLHFNWVVQLMEGRVICPLFLLKIIRYTKSVKFRF